MRKTCIRHTLKILPADLGRTAPRRTDSRSPSRLCATSSRPTRRRSTCPSSGLYRSPASAPSRDCLSRRPALQGCQAPNAVPVQQSRKPSVRCLNTRHRCRLRAAVRDVRALLHRKTITLIRLSRIRRLCSFVQFPFPSSFITSSQESYR